MTNSSDTIPLGATRTFAAMLQHVNGGEVTDSHRHTATSVYFMIQGSGIYTTAEGEQQFMEPGDLLTQPSWTWHGTTNTGKEPARHLARPLRDICVTPSNPYTFVRRGR